MSNRIALTEQQKAHLFDRLIETQVIQWRKGPRLVDAKLAERTYIEHGETKSMLVVEE
jgi:hypothetical protein